MAPRSFDPARLAPEDLALPLVSLIGRPNVGKSSLFNRLVGGRPALVEDMPGVTRDRRYGVCTWLDTRFRLVDTGGLDPSADGILGAMRAQTLRAVDEGQVLVFVVDVKEGITPVDEEVARLLRRTGKPVLVAANKVDSSKRQEGMGDVFGMGFEQVFPLSATHGRGVGDLLDAVIALVKARLPAAEGEGEAGEGAGAGEPPIRIAFVGKPNVGKSSLVNRLLGEERVLVHDQPGTTRDPIDTPFRLGERDFVLVDTAGMRRRRSIDTLTEAVAAKMARDQLARADVAALVIDAQNGATAEDAKLASLIEESGRAAVLVLNKGDLVKRAELDKRIEATRETLSFMSWAPLVVTSAVTGRAVTGIPDAAAAAFAQWSRRVTTADLNKHFEEMVARRPPPSGMAGRHVRMYYATQAGVRPPTFYVSTNHAEDVGAPYRRYLANQFRQIYGFEGSPIRVFVRGRKKKTTAAAAD
jgi:GTP-binding protein